LSRATRLVERHRGKEALSLLAAIRRAVPSALHAEWCELHGEALQQAGDFRSAHASYRQAHRRLKSSTDRWRRAEISLRLGDTARQIEAFADAIRWYTAAEGHARAVTSQRLALDAATGKAMALRGQGRYADALRLFTTLLSTYRRRRDLEGAAYILWAMGTTERFAGRIGRAHVHLRDAVNIYEKLKDASGLAYARCGWGGTLRMMGHADQSRRLYALAHGTFRLEGDRFGMAYSSCGQANGFRMGGHLSRALPFMVRAEQGYRALQLKGPLGFVLWSRAQLFIELGRWREAKEQLGLAEKAFRSAKDPRGLVYVALGKAELARAQGRPSAAVFHRVAVTARRLGLALEETHARVRSGASPMANYRRLGVSVREYSRYQSIP